MRQIGKFLRDKPLKVLACTIIAGYSGQAFTADNGQDSTKEQTIVVTADAGAQGQGQDDESNIVAHSATAGSKSSQLISRTSQSIAVITQAQIEAQAAKTIPEALRYVSGVASENAGPDTRFDTIIVRGFEADEYLDGLRLPREA
ncbi:TonB-dependent receptor plug domain-containing protein [Raoultella ornithinolytica]|nr:TonB-dependent receptor plug domain-containing protein [Raoultella ornithinolytica]WPO24862.1 TonB-dependent receptor plug domain-containing protein [Raoultella ornithinolytica]